jgi:hypothetical protein
MPHGEELKAPVKIETVIERNRTSGKYEVRVQFDDGRCVWSELTARRRDTATKEASAAIALIMKTRAELLEAQALELINKANFLRACARVRGVM